MTHSFKLIVYRNYVIYFPYRSLSWYATIWDFRIDPSCCGWSYSRQLLPWIWQRSDSYRCVLPYCQWPLFEIVHVVGLGHIVDSGCLRFDGGVVHFVVCDIVDNNFSSCSWYSLSHNWQIPLKVGKRSGSCC